MMRRLLYLLPVFIVIILCVFFVRRMMLIEQGGVPNIIPSVMIDKPVPDFTLPPLSGTKNVSSADLHGQVSLINIFASWCLPCRAEHPLLSQIRAAHIKIIGINYKDKPVTARLWLKNMGNPYDAIGIDADGHAAIDFGSYGVPESYLIDKQGVIRYKQIGPLTDDDIQNKILPLAKELQK